MELGLVIGIAFTVVALGGWLVATLLLRRHGTAAPLAPADRDAALRARSLHEQAAAGQMAAMASAQRQ
ncbi:hypothetical protein [Protaetiibacter larvae]|uniref:Uncharacterized protein n=1 Tax=Protaetiibacter larvae TaxID=2592654 RepID=A0A5C1YAR9_9MICO|nr:hypothetical protein [Protaetiibacter larvae]QEO09992.1 hypothetical protein FLP23_08235 [Protaetiibacter larvae]